MSATTPVCSIDPDLIKSVKKLTFRSSAEGEAIVMKVDTVAQSVVVDDTLEDISVDELREALPEHEPRWKAHDLLNIRTKYFQMGHKIEVFHFRTNAPWVCARAFAPDILETHSAQN